MASRAATLVKPKPKPEAKSKPKSSAKSIAAKSLVNKPTASAKSPAAPTSKSGTTSIKVSSPKAAVSKAAITKGPTIKSAAIKSAAIKPALAKVAKPIAADKEAALKIKPKTAAVSDAVVIGGAASFESAAPKPRRRTKGEIRTRIYWAVFNQALRRVAVFEFDQRGEAEKRAAKLAKATGEHHFIQKIKAIVQ